MGKIIDKLYDTLNSINYFENKNDLDAFVHAMADVKESIDKIFNENIEAIIKENNDIDCIKENMWEIREEFRHINYHIKDAKLTE